MNYKEAIEWLQGNRSMLNQMDSPSNYSNNEWLIATAQADAAMMQQAYFIVRAHHDCSELFESLDSQLCVECNGTGILDGDVSCGDGVMAMERECMFCDGKGNHGTGS
jgi:DnaJ-class molecular chaperone